MRTILLSAVLILATSANLQATEALIFDGGGYNIYILVGATDHPEVAQVRFTSPGAKDWVSIPRDKIQIKKFDMKERVLLLSFSNNNDPELPASFSLSVKKNNAVLSIGGKRIKSSFDWLE
jgi:hypothetical protein